MVKPEHAELVKSGRVKEEEKEEDSILYLRIIVSVSYPFFNFFKICLSGLHINFLSSIFLLCTPSFVYNKLSFVVFFNHFYC